MRNDEQQGGKFIPRGGEKGGDLEAVELVDDPARLHLRRVKKISLTSKL